MTIIGLGMTVFALAVGSRSAAQTPEHTLRKVLRTHHITVQARDLPDQDKALGEYVVDDARDVFAIAYYIAAVPSALPAGSLHLASWNRVAHTWSHRAIDLRQHGAPASDIGSLMALNHTRESFLVDTHLNPSAGTVVVVSRATGSVTTLPGWVLRVLPTDIVLFHHSNVHFAPTHWVELWTWDDTNRRQARLYPNAPWDPVRRAFVDTVRARYNRVGQAWFRANNHHMNPELFDTTLSDTVVVAPSGRTLAFIVNFGGGYGTPAETPAIDVIVACRGVGTSRSRCTERELRQVVGRRTDWTPTELLDEAVRSRP